jgi:hypothetical protein
MFAISESLFAAFENSLLKRQYDLIAEGDNRTANLNSRYAAGLSARKSAAIARLNATTAFS